MSLILFILYRCSVWEKKKEKKIENEEGRGEKRVKKMEREKLKERGEEMALEKEIFSAVACIINEGGTLFETPVRVLCFKVCRSRAGWVGRWGACGLTTATFFILPADNFTWHCGWTWWKNKQPCLFGGERYDNGAGDWLKKGEDRVREKERDEFV